jgi:hypothetical protein
MSDYIVSPGADLYVGPHGRLLESMGATSSRKKKPCCDGCADGTKSCGGGALGALPPRVAGPSLVVGPPVPQPQNTLFSSLPLVPIAILGIGAFFVVKMVRGRKARKNPRRKR